VAQKIKTRRSNRLNKRGTRQTGNWLVIDEQVWFSEDLDNPHTDLTCHRIARVYTCMYFEWAMELADDLAHHRLVDPGLFFAVSERRV